MRYLILVATTIASFSGFAVARESDLAGQDPRGVSATPSGDQQRPGAFKTAMGPTSAAQKPGGSGEPMTSSPPPKKVKHRHQKSAQK
jgi:hypothetical protein